MNIVRVWGGGVIETETFYRLCDELGLLVWQEFIQSSSGVDNIPSELPHFLTLLRQSAVHALKVKRNHTSLVIWSGGNELMDENRKPVTLENKNISMLADLVRTLDPARMFVPTSPSGPEAHISRTPGMSHDVHGWWQYQGNGRQYSYFGDTDSLLHSEFGCDGMSSMQTVARTLSKCPTKPERMKDNDLWRFHGDWWCTYDREETMFGHVEDIRRYIRLSQWMQAEGLRFILESNQRRKWHNSGSIIWQLSEPWPNLSCTSIVDYYGHEKQAYYWTKDAFAPLHPTLDYRRLDYAAGAAVELPLTVLTDSSIAGNAEVAWSVRGLDGATYAEETRTAHLAAAAVNRVGDVAFVMPQTADGLVLVRLTVRLGERTAVNEYYFSCENNRPYRAAASLHGGHLTARALETSPDSAVIEVRSTGDTAVLFADITDASDEWNLVRDDNFRTLLPGERWQTRVQWSRRFRIGFDDFTAHTTERPILTVDGIGLDAPVTI